MNQCTLNDCKNLATRAHEGKPVCSEHLADILIDKLYDESMVVASLERNLEAEESKNETLGQIINGQNERIAEYQMQARPVYDKIFDVIHSNRDQWYVKATVLALPLIPLAMAVHWMWQ